MRCNFGAFHSFYGDTHPIPDNCPIKSSDCSVKYYNQEVVCHTCDWKGPLSQLTNTIYGIGNGCPECGYSISD